MSCRSRERRSTGLARWWVGIGTRVGVEPWDVHAACGAGSQKRAIRRRACARERHGGAYGRGTVNIKVELRVQIAQTVEHPDKHRAVDSGLNLDQSGISTEIRRDRETGQAKRGSDNRPCAHHRANGHSQGENKPNTRHIDPSWGAFGEIELS